MNRYFCLPLIIIIIAGTMLQACKKNSSDTSSTTTTTNVSKASLVFAGNHNLLCCFNATNGQLKWSKAFDARVQITPFYANGWVYAASNGSLILGAPDFAIKKVHALDTLGNLKWSQPILCFYIEVNNGVVYAYSSTTVTAMNATTGTILWSFDYTIVPPVNTARTLGSRPVIYKGNIYANTAYGFIALDAQTGAFKWKIDNVGLHATRPKIIDDKAYLINSIGNVNVINCNTGSIIWSKRLAGDHPITLNVVGNKLVIQDELLNPSGSMVSVFDTSGNPIKKWSVNYSSVPPVQYSYNTCSPAFDGKYLHLMKYHLSQFMDVLDMETGVSFGQYGTGDYSLFSVSDVTLAGGFSFYSTSSSNAYNDTIIGQLYAKQINNNGVVANSGWQSSIRGNYRYTPCVVTADGKSHIGSEEY